MKSMKKENKTNKSKEMKEEVKQLGLLSACVVSKHEEICFKSHNNRFFRVQLS